MITSDSAFHIGKSHKVCQDYAKCCLTGNINCAIVSDGCSGSEDSDFGSRLLVRTATNLLQSFPEMKSIPDEFGKLTVHGAHLIARSLSLPEYCLDATLLVAAVFGNQYCEIRGWGDGALFAVHKNGDILLHVYDYEHGYPNYLSYELNPQRKAGLLETLGKDYDLLRLRTYQIMADGKIVFTESNCCTEIRHSFSINDYSVVGVLSDGIGSFSCRKIENTSKIQQPLTPATVADKLLRFKNLNGLFVTRRLQRFEADCREWSWEHDDDLSIAAIAIG